MGRVLYDGDALVAEYGDAGTMSARYAWGPGEDEPLLADAGGLDCTGTRVLHAEGSIVAQATCGGIATQIDRYDEYGIPGAGNAGRFGYTGQVWVPELGMWYYKARIYSPTLGRFLQTDPIGYADQNNLYAYVANDPVNGVDPTGMCTGSLISDKDGGCTGGGFVSGAGGCEGQCTSSRDRADAFIGGLKSEVARQDSPQGMKACINDASKCNITQDKSERAQATMRGLVHNPKILAAFRQALIESNPWGPTASKNESALWIGQNGNKFHITGRYAGSGDQATFYPIPPGSSIYFHTHPFTRAEGYTPGLSPQDMGLGA